MAHDLKTRHRNLQRAHQRTHDECETLRAEVERLQQKGEEACQFAGEKMLENERLREALREVRDNVLAYGGKEVEGTIVNVCNKALGEGE